MQVSALRRDDVHALRRVTERSVVIVGTGPVGMRAAQELLQREPHCPLVIYGEEPPYHRVRLTALLAGELAWEALDNALAVPVEGRVLQHHDCAVVAIDREACTVLDARGQVQPYSTLILATGSRPHVPSIAGIALRGVYTFRDLNDLRLLQVRRMSTRRTLVLGGGLLGLEVAHALKRPNNAVVAIEHGPRLMGRQLDDEAAEVLRCHVVALGIEVRVNEDVREVRGEQVVTGVRLHSGDGLDCDTLALATGIRPNVKLALEAELSIGRGIRVNDRMQTSDPHIYAVGECAEHRGRVYGLVAPGLEQAAVAVHCLLGGTASYTGSVSSTRLKVMDLPVFGMGQTGEEACSRPVRCLVHRSAVGEGVYRKLVLDRWRLVGAIAIGEWDELGRVQEAVSRRRRVWPWQRLRFQHTGRLWPAQSAQCVNDWPASATVCNCTGVTRGALGSALTRGCLTVEALAAQTGASTVCGSCRSLLAELVGTSDALPVESGNHVLLTTSLVVALVVLLIALAAPLPYGDSVQEPWQPDRLWREGFWRQVTGYTALTLASVGLVLSLRKRWQRFALGRFSVWRLLHVGVGAAALVALAIHTGLRLGENLNLVLMTCFLALTLMGAVAGGVTTLQNRIGGTAGRRLRTWWTQIHIALFWPIPMLLVFHILAAYYF